MQFKDIVGQQDVINRLTEAVDNGRVSHAQMVLGATADGSLQLALAYLQYLCCEHRVHHEPAADGHGLRADSCGECPQCKKMASLMHPDLHLFFPNASTPRVSSGSYWSGDFVSEFRDFVADRHGLGTVDEWYAWLGVENKQGVIRELDAAHIVADLGLKSYEGGWKMTLIWMAEKMNTARLVVWSLHGIYGAGKDLDETFGLIETAEKAAEIYMKIAHLPRVNTITDEQMHQLEARFGVKGREGYLD